jgi:replicative DNA helicase
MKNEVAENMQKYGSPPRVVPIKQAVDLACETLGRTGRDKRLAYSGFRELDRAIFGFMPGNVYIIGARLGMGKTALALDIVKNVALKDKKTVGIFSLEASAELIARRLLGNMAQIPRQRLREGGLSEAERERVAAAAQALKQTQIFIADSGRAVSGFRERAAQMPDLALAVIDYLQLVHSSSSALLEINEMAADLQIPVLVCAQLCHFEETRDDFRPLLNDLTELETDGDADVVLLLYREGYYNRFADKAEVTECIIAKNRHGEAGQAICLKWDNEYGSYTD